MSKLGPYDLNSIIHGDCLEVMPNIPDGSIDAIIADWPYDSIDAKWDTLIPLDDLWKENRRVLKPNGVVALTAQGEFAAILLLSNRKEYRHKWIWEKDKCGNFLAARGAPRNVTEEVLVFCRCGFAQNANNRATYNPQMSRADKYQKRTSRKNRKDTSIKSIRVRPSTSQTPFESDPSYNGWLRYPKNIIYFPVDYGKNRVHPTQKPVALMEYLIKTYTNPGDIVLDNTAGAGTTAIAAINTERNWLCIEKDKGYYQIARERIENHRKESVQMELV